MQSEINELRNERVERKQEGAVVDTLAQEVQEMREARASLQKQIVDLNTAQLDQKLELVEADFSVRFNVDELLGLDPPPPYTPRQSSGISRVVANIKELGSFSLIPLYDLNILVRLLIAKLLRPAPQKGHSRIEWTCVSTPQISRVPSTCGIQNSVRYGLIPGLERSLSIRHSFSSRIFDVNVVAFMLIFS